MSHLEAPPADVVDRVPVAVRTWAYVVGVVLGLGVAPALIAADLPVPAAIAAALSGAANALARGYVPRGAP